MSSHREAPAISRDPVADNTDLYAWMSTPTRVAILANFIPFEKPEGAPNFFQFGDNVLYKIKIDNDGDAKADVTYQFRFKSKITNPNTFLYNTGPISSLTDPNWNMRQFFSVRRIVEDEDDEDDEESKVLGKNLSTPPVNIGPRSIPPTLTIPGVAGTGYAALANSAIHDLPGNRKVFCGQREDAFNVDLGSIFDLGALRPFQFLHLIPKPAADGRDALKGFNVHTIALEVPAKDLTKGGATPSGSNDPRASIGIWANASRRRTRVREDDGEHHHAGKWVQVSRLGMPLINEVIIPASRKDKWNAKQPKNDESFLAHYLHPELQILLPILYPGVFPNLAANPARPDLVAILLTGIPAGVIPGFSGNFNFTGSRKADMLRLNVAIPPTSTPNEFGLLGGDIAGFPNGRRIGDNVVAIELRAIAGATLPLVDPSYTADGASAVLLDGTMNDVTPPLSSFPYIQHPHSGFDHVHD